MSIVYNYSPKTFEYLGSQAAVKDLKASHEAGKDIYLVPKYATDVKPPRYGENTIAIFNTTTKDWELHTDYRGKWYHKTDGTFKKIFQVDEHFDTTDYVKEVPPGPGYLWNEDTKAWVPGKTSVSISKRDQVLQKYFEELSAGYASQDGTEYSLHIDDIVKTYVLLQLASLSKRVDSTVFDKSGKKIVKKLKDTEKDLVAAYEKQIEIRAKLADKLEEIDNALTVGQVENIQW